MPAGLAAGIPSGTVAGVGRGLGRAIAERFADAGHRVAILARRAADLDAMAAARGDDRLVPVAIAKVYHDLHRQPRNAWTFELELRPWAERF